jgi:hypothetical protein
MTARGRRISNLQKLKEIRQEGKFIFDSAEFNTINIIYISLNFLAAAIGANNLLISLSVASIAFLNILIHTLGAVFARCYSP